jgi:HEAT repeat protein
LILALKNKNPLIRGGAAKTLGYMETPRAIDPLKELLKDEDEDVRESAKMSLERLGISPIEKIQSEDMLAQVLMDRNNSAESRKSAASALEKVGRNLAKRN